MIIEPGRIRFNKETQLWEYPFQDIGNTVACHSDLTALVEFLKLIELNGPLEGSPPNGKL